MENNKPQVRFKGFNEDWEEKKLSEIADIIGGGTPSTGISEFWNGNIDWYSPTEIGEKIFANESVKKITRLGLENSSAKILPANKTILFTSRAGIGDMAILSKEGATNQGFQSLVLKNGNHPYFIYSAGFLIKKYALSKASGSTFLEISSKTLGSMDFPIPKNKTEQQKIGSFFENLDKLITEHQQKHSKLKILKKAMLSKMFPQHGQTVPEIRFKGFTGDWDEKKMEEIGKATSGTSIESEFDKNGKYKVISIGSYSENSTYTDQGLRANYSEKTQSRILNQNDLTMVLNDKTSSGNILGRVLLIKEDKEFVYNQRTQRIEPYINDFYPIFLYHFFNAPNIRNKILKICQGNTQIYVNWSAVRELKYFIPKKNEQKVIGDYFENIENLIINHQFQIEKLQNIKKAFLAKMFI